MWAQIIYILWHSKSLELKRSIKSSSFTFQLSRLKHLGVKLQAPHLQHCGGPLGKRNCGACLFVQSYLTWGFNSRLEGTRNNLGPSPSILFSLAHKGRAFPESLLSISYVPDIILLSSRGEQDRCLFLVPFPSSGQPSGRKCTNKLTNITSSGVHSLGEIKQHIVAEEDYWGRMTCKASLRGKFTRNESWATGRSHSHGHWREELPIRGNSNRGKCGREACTERTPVWVEQSQGWMPGQEVRAWARQPPGTSGTGQVPPRMWKQAWDLNWNLSFLWFCVHCAGQTIMWPHQLQENPATLDSGHTVLTLRTWHGTGLWKPRERLGAEWPDFTAMESGPSLPFSHHDPYKGHESALPAQRLSRVWG